MKQTAIMICTCIIFFVLGFLTFGFYVKHGAIPDAKTAAKIGFAILSAIYGEETIKREIPFQITLLNNKEWCLDGTLPKNMTGGTAFIIIQKSDGRSLNYGHYK